MKHKKEILCLSVILMLVVLSVILPPSGKTALFDEACTVFELWIAAGYILWKIASIRRIEKTKAAREKLIRALIAAAAVSAGIFFSISLVKDVLAGPQTIMLYEPEVSRSQGHTGVLSLHYYLSGKDDQGSVHTMEISGDVYEKIQGESRHKLTVQYYEHTKRLYQYW